MNGDDFFLISCTQSTLVLTLGKGTFFSESADVFVITSNRRTFFFPETKDLNFGD